MQRQIRLTQTSQSALYLRFQEAQEAIHIHGQELAAEALRFAQIPIRNQERRQLQLMLIRALKPIAQPVL